MEGMRENDKKTEKKRDASLVTIRIQYSRAYVLAVMLTRSENTIALCFTRAVT